MAKVPLDTQTKYVWVILGRHNSPLTKDFSYYYDKLKSFLDINADIYAYIGHDKDIDDDGLPKFRHIHLLAVLKDRATAPRLSTTLNKLAKVCNIPNEDIDIEQADSVPQCIRYCIHKGYPLKYQYLIDDLQTNLNKDDLNAYLEPQNDIITASYLITTLHICNYSCVAVLKALGLKLYMKYRGVIQDIIREFKESYN